MTISVGASHGLERLSSQNVT